MKCNGVMDFEDIKKCAYCINRKFGNNSNKKLRGCAEGQHHLCTFSIEIVIKMGITAWYNHYNFA